MRGDEGVVGGTVALVGQEHLVDGVARGVEKLE